jgi:hypothetical protein
MVWSMMLESYYIFTDLKKSTLHVVVGVCVPNPIHCFLGGCTYILVNSR